MSFFKWVNIWTVLMGSSILVTCNQKNDSSLISPPENSMSNSGIIKSETITEYVYQDSFGIYIEKISKGQVEKFDIDSNIVEYSLFDSIGNPRYEYGYWKITSEFDSLGNKTEETVFRGNDSSIIEITFKYDFKYDDEMKILETSSLRLPDSSTNLTLYKYNTLGNITNSTLYDSLNRIYYMEKWEYDSSENLMDESKYNSDGTLSSTKKYDSSGNLLENTWYYQDGKLGDSRKYVFNSKGNMIKESRFKSGGDLWYYELYNYDGLGNRVEELSYNSDGRLKDTKKIGYDNSGNEISHEFFNSYGTMTRRWDSKYDDRGNQIKSHYSETRTNFYRTYLTKYDSLNREIEVIYDNVNHELSYKKEYRYDSNGNKVEQLEYDQDGKLLKRRTEEYNKHNQILERKVFETGMRFGEQVEIPISRESHTYIDY